VVAGEDDFRSPLEQVMKWVKRTRERGREGRGKVYVNILEGGHHGGVGVESAIRE
jgi:protease II